MEAYLIDNGSTDRTMAIARRHRGRGLIGDESFDSGGITDQPALLARKEQLARELEGDWILAGDADEIRLPPPGDPSLAAAVERVERLGFNAINFLEFTFVPTREAPDHDHPRFRETMRWYYPFEKKHPHRLSLWKRQSGRVDLVRSGGHRVRFPGLAICPESFPMRHYIWLSVDHALEKYGARRHAKEAVQRGFHGWRARLESLVPAEQRRFFKLLPASSYRVDDGAPLDPREPLASHPWAGG